MPGKNIGGDSEGSDNGGVNVMNGKGTDASRVKKKPRNLVYQIRMNEDEAAMLDIISYETEDTKADVIRKALKMYLSAKRGSY